MWSSRSTAQDNSRYLTVEVVSASGIMGVTQKGKAADSYVRLALYGQGGKKTKEEYYTTVKKGTLSPEWKEKFKIGSKYSVEHQDDLKITFNLGTSTSTSPSPASTVPMSPSLCISLNCLALHCALCIVLCVRHSNIVITCTAVLICISLTLFPVPIPSPSTRVSL